jgi:LCP family protein required for cell wall assembly
MADSIVTKRKSFLPLKILGLMFFFVLVSLFSFFLFYKGQERVNILVLGEAGANHAGASLTDTIIFSSVSKDGSVLMSIPRDIWYEPTQTKINEIYSMGSFPMVKDIFGRMLNQPIDAVVVINFDTFIKMVDTFGGLNVNVEGTFDDLQYPVAGKENDLCDGDLTLACRYEQLHFDAGMQMMNGETALKYARSRHAIGDEGTDYARSRRQQQVIAAFKTKIMSPDFFLNFSKVKEMIQIVKDGLPHDITKTQILSLAKILVHSSSRKVSSYVLDGWEKADGYLYHPLIHYSKLWVLLPAGDTWEGVHQFVSSIL